MTRTRITFVVIIGLTLIVIAGAFVMQLFQNDSARQASDSTNLSGEGSNGEPTDSDSTNFSDGEPTDSVLVTLASSNTKQNWLNQLVKQFNDSGQTTSAGKSIFVEVSHVTSGGSMNAIMAGDLQPTAWSPGDQSWVGQANEAWRLRENKPIATAPCQPTIYAPLGFAMWRPMAETLGWPDEAIGWDTIVALAADPAGWESFGRPEWGQFRFGHTHPAYANSGLLSMTGFVYGIAGQTEDLSADDIYAPPVEEAMRALEQNTTKYGRQAPALLELMAREGPGFLHAAAVPEADTVRFNIERKDELAFPLAFIFPAGGTIWADHPFCILDNAEWVKPEQAEAAAVFRDYLLAEEQQELAIDNFLRPLDNTIPLHAPLALEYGTDPKVNSTTIAALPSPDADVSAAIIDLFTITKRKATVMVVLDVSESMDGDKIKSARTATVEFLKRLDPNDEIGLMIFSDLVTTIAAPERAGATVEGMSDRVEGLVADGNTALYAALCEANELILEMQAEDIEAGESRLYGIILLSDGEDTIGDVTENQMFATCLPDNAEVDGIKIFPIALGTDADEAVLSRIASVSGGRLFTANPESISNVYISISAEQ